MRRDKAIESVVQAAIRETFRFAAQQTNEEVVQQWIYDHGDEIPAGVRALLVAAHNAAVTSGAYTL